MVLEGWPAILTVWFIKFLVLVHDIITFPIYFFIDKPWNRWQANRIIWAKLEDENDPYSCYVRQVCDEKSNRKHCETLNELFDYSVARFGERDCFGVREVFGEEETIKSGKVLKKLSLGKYKWLTYNEAHERMMNISRGLLALGIRSKTHVALFAETRVEWFLTAQACFRINAPIATFYATLGEESLIHCINETEVQYVITSAEQLPKLKNILRHITSITHIVCMKGFVDATTDDIPDNVKFIKFADLEELGKNNIDDSFAPPVPEDLAILMYTSGSTGVPKGVMITHKNLNTSVIGFMDMKMYEILSEENNSFIAYLPLAHVLELTAECYISSLGIKIGFSSPQTLTDFSTAVKKGEKGDLTVLKPTLMVTVPLMLDRIRNSILQLAGKEGTFTRLMFDFAVSYKTIWSDYGFQTPRLNRNLLKTYQDFMGGNLKIMLCGSAPLSMETQNFIQCCLSCQVMQGYGLTETAASACVMDYDDYSVGRVGAPLSTCKVRLVDWQEGRYFVTDKPNPRGEIVVGGDSLTVGYYKKSDLTMEAYKIENGERWFYTGDIGEMFPNGTLKIIDRKKDLVKLQFGEYVALGKVEAEMKTCILVDNICVFGTFQQNYLVALVIPNERQLRMLAKDLGKENLSYKEMCHDKEIAQQFEDRLKDHAKKCQLHGAEIPRKFNLCSDEWSPESGLVTAALKLRRKYIENHYMDIIESMYKENTLNGPHSR